MQIDDSAYFYYARQVASHPLDPYGFELVWYEQREPAMEVLAPPLLPYWWALAIRLFGNQVFLWKIWLLPFGLLLASWGLSLAKQQNRELDDTLLIAFTGYADSEYRTLAREAGFDHFLVKPIKPDELKCVLSRPVEQRPALSSEW
jgi:ActR/RegA family two-component response regulator